MERTILTHGRGSMHGRKTPFFLKNHTNKSTRTVKIAFSVSIKNRKPILVDIKGAKTSFDT